MPKEMGIYKCDECAGIIEVITRGDGGLNCCTKTMVLQKEKTEETGLTEKHRPVVIQEDDGATIKIGSVPHPMTEEHQIEWVEVITKGKICRYTHEVGDEPEVRSWLKDHSYVRAYCNIHGLWKN